MVKTDWGSVQSSPDGIGALLGDLPDLLVAQVLIGHQEQQTAVLLGQPIEGVLDPLPQFLGLERPQRILGNGVC